MLSGHTDITCYEFLGHTDLTLHAFAGSCHNNLPSSLTVSELIDLFSSLLHSGQDDKNEKEKYREDLLERLSLTGHLGSQYGSLSIGVKRKVGLLLALVNKPELILLDEPVAGLDDASQK